MKDLRIYRGGFGTWQAQGIYCFSTVYKNIGEAKRIAEENGYDTLSYLEGTQRPKLKIINLK